MYVEWDLVLSHVDMRDPASKRTIGLVSTWPWKDSIEWQQQYFFPRGLGILKLCTRVKMFCCGEAVSLQDIQKADNNSATVDTSGCIVYIMYVVVVPPSAMECGLICKDHTSRKEVVHSCSCITINN